MDRARPVATSSPVKSMRFMSPIPWQNRHTTYPQHWALWPSTSGLTRCFAAVGPQPSFGNGAFIALRAGRLLMSVSQYPYGTRQHKKTATQDGLNTQRAINGCRRTIDIDWNGLPFTHGQCILNGLSHLRVTRYQTWVGFV